ncbi:hypothetical protein GCM10011503_04120 [Henriciella pelagia]|uniref:Secreted protein n=1 Tax=Henriciella pelagia TaxID=1977912 RepID=A0ABQ1J512_9PROT|nr:hypothetical protein GCM10011503_04120 [Henriciella pelagia]
MASGKVIAIELFVIWTYLFGHEDGGTDRKGLQQFVDRSHQSDRRSFKRGKRRFSPQGLQTNFRVRKSSTHTLFDWIKDKEVGQATGQSAKA